MIGEQFLFPSALQLISFFSLRGYYEWLLLLSLSLQVALCANAAVTS